MAKTNSATTPTPRVTWRRLLSVTAWVALAAGAFFWGRQFTGGHATAQAPYRSASASKTPSPNPYSDEYRRRIVAYIDNGKVAITREELAEYLIERYGARTINLLVNKKIVELECQRKNITVTPEEVNAVLAADVKKMGIDVKQFTNDILKRYKKTLFEWKADVVRPRILLTKLSRGKVTVTTEDLQAAFEAKYGEQRQCQVIFWPMKEQDRVFNTDYPKIRNNPEEFDRCARQCFIPSIAAQKGILPPIGRHTLDDAELEKLIFSLKEGEVSHVQQVSNNLLVVVKCLKHIPGDTTKTIANTRAELEPMIREKKETLAVSTTFAELQQKSKAKIQMTRFNPDDGVVDPSTILPASYGADPSQAQSAPQSQPSRTTTPVGTTPPLRKVPETKSDVKLPEPVTSPKDMKK